MTVSLRPRSAGSGGRAGPPSNGCRSTTLNCTSWMWIGCASSVKLWISQTSTESSAGFSVIGSIHCSDVAVPSGLTVPSSASRGPTSGSTSEPASLSETLRTLPAGAGATGGGAGRVSCAGGTLVSRPTRGTTVNRITWPVVPGSANGKSTPGTPPPNGSSGPSLTRCTRAPPGGVAGDQREDQEPGVAAVQQPQPVAARLDLKLRPGAAVDDHRVVEGLRVPDR